MAAPIDQVAVESEINRLRTILEKETDTFEILAVDAAKKEAHYKAAWASAYIHEKGSIKEREAWADYRMEEQCNDFKIAEALVKAKREKLASLRTSIDALRTLAANVRSLVNG